MALRLFLVVAILLLPGLALATEKPLVEAAPVVPVESVSLDGPEKQSGAARHGLVFLELFTAEICPFCPQAERNFNDMIQDERIVGYSCMVDYFNGTGKRDDAARPFCKTQQDLYRRLIGTGARYTPQLIINGRREMPGRNMKDTTDAVRHARENDPPLHMLDIRAGAQDGTYDVILPTLSNGADERFVLRIVTVRRHAEGVPSYLATALEDVGVWDGKKMIWTARPAKAADGDSLIFLVQSRATGHIAAAGEVGGF